MATYTVKTNLLLQTGVTVNKSGAMEMSDMWTLYTMGQ